MKTQSTKRQKFYLTLDADGYYTLTKLRPEIRRGRVYVRYGEPVGYRHVCAFAALKLFGVTEAEPLVPIKVYLQGGVF